MTLPEHPITVVVVEDSPTVRELLVALLNADPALRVIGVARDGEEGVAMVERLRPAVVTMDINMPRVDGFEATRRIMARVPTPIVIVSGEWDTREVRTTFRAMEAGALAVLPRPRGMHDPGFADSARELVRTVRLMAEVPVVHRWTGARAEAPAAPEAMAAGASAEIVAIGASTGGPQALLAILSKLPRTFPAPIVIVQHMSCGFVTGFAEWLQQASNFAVSVAASGEFLTPGCAYIAPDHVHLEIRRGPVAVLRDGEPENGVRPSISRLFRSVADTYGPRAIGVLLSGMGRDGADQLKRLHEAGAVTIIQDEESSIVFGMAGEALRTGAATYVLPLDHIAVMLQRVVIHAPRPVAHDAAGAS